MPSSAVLEPRAPSVTLENIDAQCLRVTTEWINVYLLLCVSEVTSLVDIPNPFGRRLEGAYEVFWYPKKLAQQLVELSDYDEEARKIKQVFTYRSKFHSAMHEHVTERFNRTPRL
jgi:hypothetical protein